MVTSALVAAACASIVGLPDVPNIGDGGGGSTSGSGTTGGSTSSSGSGGGTSSGSSSGMVGDADNGEEAGANCTAPELYRNPEGSIFCGPESDGGALYCSKGTQCCLGGTLGEDSYYPNVCGTFGGACDNPEGDAGEFSSAVPVECEQVSDCLANGILRAACCLKGAKAPAQVAGCPAGVIKATLGVSIVCETGGSVGSSGAPSCVSGEIQICAQNADCPVGQACVPMRWKGFTLGYCMAM